MNPSSSLLIILVRPVHRSAPSTKSAANQNTSTCRPAGVVKKEKIFTANSSKPAHLSKVDLSEMTHFPSDSWNSSSGGHLPNPAVVYGPGGEVAFPQIWSQEGQPTYNDIIGFQDLGEVDNFK